MYSGWHKATGGRLLGKIKIERNTVEETLLIPLYARKAASEEYPELIQDEWARAVIERLDLPQGLYVNSGSVAMRYGALEAVQRVYGLTYVVKEYLKAHPRAAVVDMGAGLDDLFRRVDNGVCKGLNVDLADVIRIRDELAFPSEREVNLAYDLNDYSWMDEVDGEDGAVFAASGVLYYFTREEAERLIKALAGRFPKGALVFDCANSIGLGMMWKAVLSKAGMGSAKAYFSLTDPVREISSLSPRVGSVTAKSCMRGYRKLEGTGLLFRFLDWAADNVAGMRIVKVSFT